MTVAKFMTKRDTVNDIGIFVLKIFSEFGKAGAKTFHLLKILLYDTTLTLNKLPFGNWISIIYFIFMINAIKNVVEGGELNRIIMRAIDLYIIQQKSFSECFNRAQHYVWRLAMGKIAEAQSWVYGMMSYAWTQTSGSVKREVNRFAKEVILDNAEDIEQTIKDVVKTAAFSAMVTTVSQKIITDLGPVAVDAFSKSDIAKHLTDSVTMVAESHLLENDSLLNQKLTEISMQLEYLRVNQPNQFREILQTLSLSTLALNDVVLPSTVIDTFAKLKGTLGSSLSQQGQRRIENI